MGDKRGKKRHSKKSKKGKSSGSKKHDKPLTAIVAKVKACLRKHKVSRQDFKHIAKKCSEKLHKNYEAKCKRKPQDPEAWLEKRESKIEALVSKYCGML